MELTQLKQFKTVAEKNSISLASRELHISQPALSTAIKKLEQELGWKPVHSFASGLRETVHWYLENEAWWRMLKGRRIDFTGGWSTIKAQTGLEKDSR